MMFLFSHVCDVGMTLCSRQLGAVVISLGYFTWLFLLAVASQSVEHRSSKSHVVALSSVLSLSTPLKAMDIYIQ